MFIVRNDAFNFPYYVRFWKDNIVVWDRHKNKSKIFTDVRLKSAFLNKSLIIEELQLI